MDLEGQGSVGAPSAAGGTLILIFAKEPREGHAKTRLARAIGKERAAQFASAFLADTCERLIEWGRVPVWLCGDTLDSRPFREHLRGSIERYVSQGDGDLGTRLIRTFAEAFCSGAEKVIVIGSDTPHLPCSRLDESLLVLKNGTAVLGPAHDGGFYLLGLPAKPKIASTLLAGHEWGSRNVLGSMREALSQSGIAWSELEAFWDFDEVDDLVQWQRASLQRDPRETLPRRTMALVAELGLS